MRIENNSIYVGNMTNSISGNRISNKETNNRENYGSGIIGEKRKQAQKKAMNVIGTAFTNELNIDSDIKERKDKVVKLQENIAKSNEKLEELGKKKSELMNTYEINEDSEEQRELNLLERRVEAEITNKPSDFTKEELDILADIDKKGMTDYQKQVLDIHKEACIYKDKVDNDSKEIVVENAVVRGVKLERLKSSPMLEATKEAEKVLENANKEIIGMMTEELKKNIDDLQEEEKDKAEDKKADKEKEEERIEKQIEELRSKRKEAEGSSDSDTNGQIMTPDIPSDMMIQLDEIRKDAQTEVQNIVDKMKLVAEDIKGAVVDSQL